MTINLTDPANEITFEQAMLEVRGLSPAEAYQKAWSRRAAMLKHPASIHASTDADCSAEIKQPSSNSFTDAELEAMAHGNNPQANAYRELLAFRRNSPAAPDSWIPVSELMPDREVDVQLYCADSKEQMVGFMEREESEGYFRFATWRSGAGTYCKPSHWQPLPAAPKEVG